MVSFLVTAFVIVLGCGIAWAVVGAFGLDAPFDKILRGLVLLILLVLLLKAAGALGPAWRIHLGGV
jgi:hypothetical protein